MTQQTAKPDQWTDEQWQAIIRKGHNLLVAAAAGSGKTSVLVERIIRKVTDTTEPVGVDQLLVVTFTNAAAAEMRQRIGDALRRAIELKPHSAHLRRQLTLLQRATITTLHSFCLELLRQYYYLVDLDPDFRIADPMEIELLRQDVLEAKLEEWYELDPDFQALADLMVDGQDDAGLQALLLKIYDFSRSHPRPAEWLDGVAAAFAVEETTPLEQLPWTRSILRAIQLELQAISSSLAKAILLAASAEGPNAYVPLLEAEQTGVQAALQAAKQGWSQLQLALQAIQFQRLPAVRDVDQQLKEQVQALRDGVKKRLKALEDDYFSTPSVDYLRDLAKLAPHMQTLVRLVKEYEEAFTKEKRARSLVDFGDLEHVALQILTQREEAGTIGPSEVAVSLRARFAEVLVDEYQDINLVQETILQMVSRPASAQSAANRFMVGDVKQSIYRFRLAEPNLFMQKYQEYATDLDSRTATGLRIDLAANFRSRSEVVDAVNYLFRLIMTPGVGELAYDRAAELICRASYPQVEPERLQPEVHLIDRSAPDEGEETDNGAEETEGEAGAAVAGDPAEEASVAQLEARLIARRIRKWMEPGEGEKPLLVFDKKAGGLRQVAYRDIVILLRATAGWGAIFQEELRAAGIPVYAEQSGGYFAAPEVELMLSLLRLIDNPLQDIPLAAVLRSPIGHMKEEELAQIRIASPGGSFHQAVARFLEQESGDEAVRRKLKGFYARLNRWRTEARQGSLASLLALIYRETGYLDYVTGMEHGHQRRANLRILYDRAKQYESGSYRGLFRFLRFVDRMQQAGNDLGEARTVSESEDVVRIMTIHKSKGLEFPVVFVAGLGKQFNTMDIKSSFLLHKDLGFGPQVADPELRLRYPSLAMLGIRQELRRELLAEEMRVLYVALTRAREKLVLVGSAKDLGKSIVSWSHQQTDKQTLADEDLQQAKGFMDWIGRALLRHPAAKELRAYPLEKGLEAQAITLPLVQDQSRWSFHLYQAAEFAGGQASEERSEQAYWQQLLGREAIAGRPGDEGWKKEIEHALGWEYPHQAATTTAAKWSVSDLKQRHQATSGMPYRLPRINQKPLFLSTGEATRFSAAELGTILHTVMQHLELHRALDEPDIRLQIDRLVERQYLTREQADAVHASQIAAFFASELGRRMKQARSVYRELPFTLAIPAAEIRPELAAAPKEKVIVQGVIDCMFEEADGRLVLLDFKTDGIAAEPTDEVIAQLRERYQEQLRYYNRAVREIWKREVAETYLYLFAGGFSLSFSEGWDSKKEKG